MLSRRKTLTAAFSALMLMSPAYGLADPAPSIKAVSHESADAKPYNCPEIDPLELMAEDNKRIGRTDPNLDAIIEQQREVCDKRFLLEDLTSSGKSFDPWEEPEPILKNWNSPKRFDL